MTISLLGLPLSFISGIISMLQGYRPAKFYVLAFSSMTIGALFFIFHLVGVIPGDNFFLVNSGPLGNAAQLLLLSMGLANRFNLMQEEALIKEKAGLKKEREASFVIEEAKFKLEKYSHDLELEVKEKTKSIKSILDGLDQALFTFDKDFIVGEEFSASTKTIFEINPAWKNVTEIFRFNKEEEHSFNKWCGNVWRKKLAFKDLLPLAPKACTRVEGKYIQLEFVPIYKNDEKKIDIDRIICKAIDKTLEKEFEKKAQEQKDKSAMVLLVLERPLEFLDLMEELGGIIESSLGKAVERNFDEIFRVFHTLKARFLQMKMMVLAEQIQLIETVFSDLRDLKGEEEYLSSNEKEWFKSEIGILGDLFKDFVKDNHKFIEMVNKSIIKDANEEGLPASEILKFIANELGHHSHFYNQFRDQFILEKISDKFSCYENLVRDISSSLGKEVVLLIKESSFKVDSTKYSKFINSCIHLFRNAVDHGIEDSWIRVEKGKNMCGKIKVRFEEIENDHFKIIVEDDGQGIDPKIILKVAKDSKNFENEDLDTMDDKKLIQLIFSPGFSSREKVTKISGRGIGLDAVKSEALNLGGDIIVESSPGRGTTFMIILPLLK